MNIKILVFFCVLAFVAHLVESQNYPNRRGPQQRGRASPVRRPPPPGFQRATPIRQPIRPPRSQPLRRRCDSPSLRPGRIPYRPQPFPVSPVAPAPVPPVAPAAPLFSENPNADAVEPQPDQPQQSDAAEVPSEPAVEQPAEESPVEAQPAVEPQPEAAPADVEE